MWNVSLNLICWPRRQKSITNVGWMVEHPVFYCHWQSATGSLNQAVLASGDTIQWSPYYFSKQSILANKLRLVIRSTRFRVDLQPSESSIEIIVSISYWCAFYSWSECLPYYSTEYKKKRSTKILLSRSWWVILASFSCNCHWYQTGINKQTWSNKYHVAKGARTEGRFVQFCKTLLSKARGGA